MRIRRFEETDRERLEAIHESNNYGFEFPDNVLFVEETTGIGVAVKMVPEVTLICPHGDNIHPLVKLKAIDMLHQSLAEELTGCDEAFAFIPPEIEKPWGNHLMRKFGWEKTWAAFRIKRKLPQT